MPQVAAVDILPAARASGNGVGAFNVIQIEHAEAIAAAAERSGSPVILQISENAARWHGGLAPIADAVLRIADECSAPVLVHLDHATDESLVDQAILLGFGSVMFDASTLPYAENLARTAAVVARAHRAQVWVEAELGEVGGKLGAHTPGALTDCREAVDFVAATGIDSLAVAVGSSHAMVDRTAALNLDRIAELAAALELPLVLHGSSGVPDAEIQRAVAAGLTKVNISTHLNKVMTGAIRRYLADNPGVVDPRKYLGSGRDALTIEVERLISVFQGPVQQASGRLSSA